jgi:formylglycine-generating enzyme required for sulfatase activity
MVGPIRVPIELLEQFERGNVLLFAGEDINRGILPSSAELAEELAARCDYPPEDPLSLPRVAGYYELTRDRHGLVQFLRDRLERPGLVLPRAHKLVAQLRPPVVVTACYDRLLERALREAGVPYVPVVGNAEVAYAERDKVLLVWLWGVLDQPDSIVVTEDDRRLFLQGRANLSDVLRSELARRTWLFVGFDAEDEWFRGFYDSVNRGLDRQSRRSYIFGATLSAYTRAWWEKRNAEILSAEAEAFLTALTEQLAARARPRPKPRPVTAVAEPLPLPEEPYKALAFYEARDRALFFGRDREIEGLTALVHAHRLVLFYGASGVGKTSLLQAGVIPRLEEADPVYAVVSVRALTDPADAIRAALRRKLPDAELPDDAVSLVDFLAAAARASDRSLVLVIDQFEEFFIRLSPEFRAEFIAELGALHDARDVPVKVVLSLREDYLARVSELEHRIPDVFRTKMRLLPLSRQQARDAVVCPVEALGYAYEPTLVEQLLDDLTREGVMPPQLQLVCHAIFHHVRAEGRKTLTLTDYEALGGAQGVLRGYLDEELRRFPAEEHALARDLLEELVTSERTKKVETLAELQVALNAEPAVLSAVADKLVRARLLRPVERADTPERAYELAHEYLIAEIALSPEAVARKEAEELLRQGVDTWRRFGALLSVEEFELLDEQRERLRLDAEAQELMLRGALRHGRSVGYWLRRLDDEEAALALAEETLLAPEGERARRSLGAEADDLAPQRRRALVDRLAETWREAKGTARACASDALWALRSHLLPGLRLRLALSRSPRLMWRVALPVAWVLMGALVIALIVWGPPFLAPEPDMEWVDVPAGEFMMGSDPAVDPNAYDDAEMPQHPVYVDAFRISKYEVTNAQYAQCVRATVCDEPGQLQDYLDPAHADHPVVYVSWYDAQTFCEWVGGRLPTEAEWEYAARGTGGRIYPWGKEFAESKCNTSESGIDDTTEVGSYPDGASPYGAMDMAGNVWEWVADWFNADYYSMAPGRNPRGSDSGSSRVLRGGSWLSNQKNARCAFRQGDDPATRRKFIGFRVAAFPGSP